jgi:CRP/FNR family transcriptional regulator, anaerobic regulatory protein
VAISNTDQPKRDFSEAFEIIGLNGFVLNNMPPVSATLRKLRTGQTLFSQGEVCACVFVIRLGTIKTLSIDEVGFEHVLHFSLRTDMLGVEASAVGVHDSYAIALEDSEVIVIPLDQFKKTPEIGKLVERHIFHRACLRMNQRYMLMAVMGTLGADARVARFLVSLADRYALLGYSRNCFVLRMSRQEIASHLGLTMETVSRAFSHLSTLKLIECDQRHQTEQFGVFA